MLQETKPYFHPRLPACLPASASLPVKSAHSPLGLSERTKSAVFLFLLERKVTTDADGGGGGTGTMEARKVRAASKRSNGHYSSTLREEKERVRSLWGENDTADRRAALAQARPHQNTGVLTDQF